MRTRLEHAARKEAKMSTEDEVLNHPHPHPHPHLEGPMDTDETIHSPRSLRISIGSEDLHPCLSTPGTVSNIGPDPSSLRAINSAILSHLLKSRLKMTALTLQDEAGLGDEVLPSLSLPSRVKTDLDEAEADGTEIWKWMQAAEREKKHRHHLHRMATTPKGMTSTPKGSFTEAESQAASGGGGGGPVVEESEDQQREREKDEEIERLLHELGESKMRSAELKEQNRKSTLLLKQYQMSSGSGGFSSPPSFTMANPSIVFARPSNLSVLYPSDVRSSTSMGGAPSSSPTPSPIGPPPVNLELHNRLSSIVSMLLDLMPRLVPSLTAKAKLESLPIIEALISDAEVDLTQRTSLISLVLNLISTPDEGQRKAIFSTMESLAEKLGPSWVSGELLNMCSKQVTHPASERRILAAQLLTLCATKSEVGTPHLVLTHLQKLTEDRIEQVREAAIHSISALIPRLPTFSRQYYQGFEDVILDLCSDGSETLLEVVRNVLLPVLLSWAEEADVIVTSFLPKLMTKMGDAVRHGVEKHHPSSSAGQDPNHNSWYQPGSLPFHPVTFSDQLSSFHHHPLDADHSTTTSTTLCHRGLIFPNHDYQVAYHLLGMYIALLPALRVSALRACPHNLLSSSHFQPPKAINADLASLQESQEGEEEDGGTAAIEAAPPSPFSSHAGVRSASSAAIAAMSDSESDAVFASWAISKDPGQWKIMKWLISFIAPSLIEAARIIPMSEDSIDFRRQLALSLSFTAVTFGSGFNASTLLPLFSAASGCQPAGQVTSPSEILGRIVPDHIREAAQDLMPHTPEETKVARERVLPMLLAGLLPPSGLLATFLSLALSSSDTLTGRWVVEMPREIHAAVAFVADVHGPDLHTPELLSVLEKMASGRGGVGTVTTAVGVSSVSVIQGLLPAAAATAAASRLSASAHAKAEEAPKTEDGAEEEEVEESRVGREISLSVGSDIMKRRLMPLLMLLMSRGDTIVQGACIWALLEVILRFSEDTKLVDQVTVVFDSMLNPSTSAAIGGGGTDAVSATVLAAMNRLAASVAPSATRSAASANLIEWLLNSVHSLASSRLGVTDPVTPTASPSPANAAALPSGVRSVDNQRLLAGQLMHIISSIHAHDTRLPRLHSLMVTCVEVLYKNRSLLVPEQSQAIGNMKREKASAAPVHEPSSSSVATRSSTVTKSSNSKEQMQTHAASSSTIPNATSSSSQPVELPSSGEQNAPVTGMRARLQSLRKKLGGGGNTVAATGSASILNVASNGSAAESLPPVHKLLGPGVSLQYSQGSPGRMSISGARHHNRTASTFGFFSDDEEDA